MNIDSWAIVFATLMGPVLAVQAQQWIAEWKAGRNRKLGIFRALMNTRANLLSADAVNAFNAVPLEYRGDEDVLGPWKIYFDHLETKSEDQAGWGDKRWDLYSQFLLAMSKHLGYTFDLVDIKKKIYSPQAHGKQQSDQEIIREAVVGLLTGKNTLPVQVRADDAAVQRINALQIALLDWLTGKTAPTVKVAAPKAS